MGDYKQYVFNGTNNNMGSIDVEYNRTSGQELTVECWIYPTLFSSYKGIVGQRLGDGVNGVNWQVLMNDTVLTYAYNNALINLGYSPPLNTWTHIALVVNNTMQAKLYVNGILQNTINTFYYGAINTGFSIGNSSYAINESQTFSGSIAEVRIWGVARSQEEIQENMKYGLIGNENGLLGYYPLNNDEPKDLVSGKKLNKTNITTTVSTLSPSTVKYVIRRLLLKSNNKLYSLKSEEILHEIPSTSIDNFINYGSASIENFNAINTNKNYVLSNTESIDTDGLLKTQINRKPLSIKFN